jgi:uncharacterized protein with ATP-grasp and redox domains
MISDYRCFFCFAKAFEKLLDSERLSEVYFLLMVKCDVIADALHVKKGDFVVKKNNF